jgi:hypothetical protein
LKEDGIRLEKFDVFVQQDMRWFQEHKEKPVDYGHWGRSEFEEDNLSIEPAEVKHSLTVLFHPGSRYVDKLV